MDHTTRRAHREGIDAAGRWLLALRCGEASWPLALSDGYPLHGCKPYPVSHLRLGLGLADGWYTTADWRIWDRVEPVRKSNPALSPSARQHKRAMRREERTRRESRLTREAQRAERLRKWRDGKAR